MTPSLATLVSCAVVVLLLAATPAAEAASCGPSTSGVPAPGCNAGTTRPMMPALPKLLQNLSPGTRGIRANPCAPGGLRGEGMPGCNADEVGAVVQGVTTFMQMFAPAAPPPR